MPEKRRLVSELQAANPLATLPNLDGDLDDVVDVALGIDAARDRQTHQVHLGGFAEHQRADLGRADAAFEVEFGGERHTRKLARPNMGQKGASVNVDGVT